MPPAGEPSGPAVAPSGPTGPPAPVLPAGLRVVAYLLLIYTLESLGGVALLAQLAPDLLEAAMAVARGELEPEAMPEMGLGLALAIQALLAPLLVVVTLIFLRRVDGKPVLALGIGRPAGRRRDVRRQLVIAASAAGALLMMWLLLAALLGEVTVGGLRPPFAAGPAQPAPGYLAGGGRLGLYLVGFLIAAAIEEWVFRGYVYSTLRERYSWANAAGLSGVLFALVHAPNPGISPVALINAFLVALALAVLREQTGSLWAGIVFRGVWSFVLGCVLSLPVSGMAALRLFEVETRGAELITGGDYGPEASLVTTVLLLPAALVLAYLLSLRPPPNGDSAGEPTERG